MGWEIFEKVTRRSTTPMMTISKLGRFAFNGAAAKILSDNAVDSVLAMWDKDTRKIGVRSIAKKDARAYTVRYARKNASAGFAVKTFLAHIGYDFSETRSFPCEWNEDDQTCVISIPADILSKQPQRFPRLARGQKTSGEVSGKMKASGAI